MTRWTMFAVAVTMIGRTQAQPASRTSDLFSSTVIRTGADPGPVAIADLNHDGRLDLVLANENAGSITVMLGDGKGGFHAATGSPFRAGHLPVDIAIADMNGDGNPDLVIPNTQTPYITVMLGDGKGGFRDAPGSPFTTKSQPHPHGVVAEHFCGAGKPLDVVTDSWGSRQVELMIGDGKGGLTAGPFFAAGPGSDAPLRSADFDHNGTPDVVMLDTAIGRWNENRLSILLGDGNCGFRAAPGSPFPAGAVPWSVAVGDLNGDGNADLAILPYGPQVPDAARIAMTVLAGDGKGGFHAMPGSPFALPGCASPYRSAIGEVNGDRLADAVVSCINSDTILVFLGQPRGEFQSSPMIVPTGSSKAAEGRGVAIADLRGRGKNDIVVTNSAAGTITIFSAK